MEGIIIAKFEDVPVDELTEDIILNACLSEIKDSDEAFDMMDRIMMIMKW